MFAMCCVCVEVKLVSSALPSLFFSLQRKKIGGIPWRQFAGPCNVFPSFTPLLPSSLTCTSLPQEKSGASVQRLTPLLVSQIVKAVQQHKDDSFQVDGQELNQVSVVGTIKHVAKLATNLTIVLADSTGEVDVRQWLDNDDGNADKFRQGQMVRVIGKFLLPGR